MELNFGIDNQYQQTIDYLFSSLPMYQKVGKTAFKKDLTNIKALCDYLDNPQDKITAIHIAGTNGKGSTSNILAAIFQEAGYKTGLYTSPHYVDFRERIRINGAMISQQSVIDFVKLIKPAIDKIQPSFFEITVAMSFYYFAKEKIEIAIIETGLGGRLDSTNIINPILSVITNISLDHTDMLGNTIPEIAFEKAGIIKQNIPVVIGEKHNESTPVFEKKANECNSKIYYAEDNIQLTLINQNFEYQKFIVKKNNEILIEELVTDLLGSYQNKNIRTALAALQIIKNDFKLSNKVVKNALKKVKKITQFQGRLQLLKKDPIILADAAHNEDGIKKLLEYLAQFGFENITFIIGFVKDKNIDKILDLLPKNATYIVTEPSIFRKLEHINCSSVMTSKNITHKTFFNVKFALNSLLNTSFEGQIICIMGSSFLVSDAICYFNEY